MQSRAALSRQQGAATATPDRTDQSDILSLCDDNLVYSCHLFDGITAGLLSPFHYYGIPFHFFLALLGLLTIAARKGVLQPFHVAWGLTLLGFFFVIMLTGNVRPRFRFVFEPFWFLYTAILVESLWLGGKRLLRK